MSSYPDCCDYQSVLNTACAISEQASAISEQETKPVVTADNVMPCRNRVQAGKGEGCKGKVDFQAQGLVNTHKNTYGSPH